MVNDTHTRKRRSDVVLYNAVLQNVMILFQTISDLTSSNRTKLGLEGAGGLRSTVIVLLP